MDRCPYCGSDFGYYTKHYVQLEYYYTFDNEADGSSNGEEFEIKLPQRKKMFCRECNKYIGMKAEVE